MFDIMEEYEKDTLFQISSLSFDHPLDYFEKQTLKDRIFYVVSLKQIYFHEGVDLDTIEFVKYLIEASTHLNDEEIEKFVFDPNLSSKLLEIHFDHPSSWQIVCPLANHKNQLFSLSDYRYFHSYFDRILMEVKRKKFSTFETILYIYDIVKEYNYVENSHPNFLDVILKKEASNEEYQYLLKEFLDRLKIPSYIGKVATKVGISYMVFAHVQDEKYSMDGYYLFDPSSDYLPPFKYKTNLISKLNYNFFGLFIEDIDHLSTGDFLKDILGVYALSNKVLAKERFLILKEKYSKKEIEYFEDLFGNDFEVLYDKIHHTKPLSVTLLEQLILATYPKEELEKNKKSFLKLFAKNYMLRRSELFKNEDATELNNIDEKK